jgi:hypothetical protein
MRATIVWTRYRIRKKGLRKGFELCHVLCQVSAQGPKGHRVRGFRLSPGFEPCWVIRSHGDLVEFCQGFCQHSLWILWIYDSRYFQIAPWLTGLLVTSGNGISFGPNWIDTICTGVPGCIF